MFEIPGFRWCCSIYIITILTSCIAFVSPWQLYNGVEVKVITSHDWLGARDVCQQDGGMVATPVSINLIDAVIAVSGPPYPGYYWSGFKKVGASSLQNELYTTDSTTVKWRMGHHYSDAGDCVAVEVLLVGVRFYSLNCSENLDVVCYKPNDIFTTNPHYVNISQPLTVLDKLDNTVADSCPIFCLSRIDCNGYSYDISTSTCQIFNEESLNNVTLLVNATASLDLNNVCEAVNVSEVVNGSNASTCGVIPWYNYDLKFRKGCILLDVSAVNTSVGDVINYDCDYLYTPTPGQIQCGVDYRWNSLPHCTIQGPSCPEGWEEYEGYCYLMDFIPRSWWEGIDYCAIYNAFPLYIQSEEEMLYLDKLLYNYINATFWTGGANRELKNWFRWTQQYGEMSYERWEMKKWSGKQCVTIKKSDSTDEYYYTSTDCHQNHPVICKIGRIPVGESYCLDSTWCRGNGYCNTYGSTPYCMCYNRQMFGANKDNMTYCSYEWSNVNSLNIKIIYDKLPRNMASIVCKIEKGTLVTMVTKDIETALKTTLYTSGKTTTYWTSLYMNKKGDYYMPGAAEYELIETDYLPWRRQPVYVVNDTNSFGVYMTTTALGVRLHGTTKWGSYRRSVCLQPDYSRFVPSDNSLLTPYNSLIDIISTDHCYMECFYDDTCISFTYNISGKSCDLFTQVSAGSNADPNLVDRTYSGCAPLTLPWNGYYTSTIQLKIGSDVTYSCDEGYQIVSPYTSTVTCGANGRWNQVPTCIRNPPRCPIGWEQNGTLCYYLSRGDITWGSAKGQCESMDSVLVNIHSDEEMDFLTLLLDEDSESNYWTGGNDILTNYWYTWTPDVLTYIPYFKWFPGFTNTSMFDDGSNMTYGEPSGSTFEDCISLKRIYSKLDIDVGEVYYADESCYNENRYVCKQSLLNIGQMNCSTYQASPCKTNSSCVDDRCTCNPGYLQIGLDDVNTTECSLILPIGSTYSCKGLDDLCVNNSICVSNECACPFGYHINGVANSYATTCELGELPKCPSGWTLFVGKCYSLFAYVTTPVVSRPAMTCGSKMSHPVIVDSFEENEFVLSLGDKVNVIKLMGLMTTDQKGLIWLDYTTPTYTNFYAATTTSSNGTGADQHGYFNPIGYWEFTTLNKMITYIPEYPLTMLMAVCERPTVCPMLPYVEYASYLNKTYDLGHQYTYKCEDGFIFGTDVDGQVICVPSTGEWTDIPVCVSLFDTVFNTLELSDLYGISIHESTVFTNSCASACHDSELCEAFVFNSDTSTCKLYTNVTKDFHASMETLSTQGSNNVWRKQECGVPPRVQFAEKNSTGRSFGSTVTYTCGISYRLKKGMMDTLTCNETGQWYPEAPICLSRFEASKGLLRDGLPIKRIYEAAFTNEECRDLCIEERTFRCLLSCFSEGVCFLFDRLKSDVGRLSRIYPNGEVSELMDSDLEEFDLHYRQLINITELSVLDVSLELCAYQCLIEDACTGFSYFFESTIGVEYALCKLYDIPDILQNSTIDVNSKLYVPKPGCGPLPVIPNLVFETTLQQNPNKYSFGDKFTARCLNFGEELLNGHSGEIECLKTMKWSKLPVCKNLCDAGWYMLNKNCYKLFDVALPFWEAFDNCHAHNSGLINLNSDQEMQNLISVWNHTAGISNGSVWMGLFWDVWSWKWSEHLEMNITASNTLVDLPMKMHGHAVIINIHDNITDLSTQSTEVPYQYFCEKAAGNLACPTGWRNYIGNCVKLFSDAKLSFKDAQTSCENINATLISMHSIFDQDITSWLVSLSSESLAYTGLYHDKNGQYNWVDGSRLDYQFYSTQEIEPARNVCIIARNSGLLIGYGATCDVQRAYICQIPIDTFGEATNFTHLPCSTDEYCADSRFHCTGYNINGVFYAPECRPKNCPPPWRFLDDRCYKFDSNAKQGFVDALDKCNRDGGYLASPLSVWNHHHMYFYYPDRYWIGLMDNIDVFGEVNTLWVKNQNKVAYSYIGAKPIVEFCVFIFPTFSAVGWGPNTICTASEKYLCEKQPVVDLTAPQYEGCFGETSNMTIKDITEEIWTDSALMTTNLCIDHCLAKGYKYAGIRNGDICSCGNSRGRYGLSPGSNCGISCPGNAAQKCGGTGHNSVYRTSGNTCSATMLKSPFDPSTCYSMVLNKHKQTWAGLDCIQQGGSLVKFDNLVVEDDVYNQMLLGSLHYGQIVGNNYMWIGLHYNDYKGENSLSWNDGVDADWMRFGGSSSSNLDKCVVSDIASEGAWKKHQCRYAWNTDPTAFYVCQFSDSISSQVTGQNIQRTYYNRELHQNVVEGSWKVTSGYLDNKCINNPNLCPEGFTITFWLRIPSNVDSSMVLSTGNCHSLLIKTSGFCIFYSNFSLTLYDVRFEKVKMGQTALQTDTWSFFTLYFESEDIFLFTDGDFITSLNSSDHQRNSTGIIFDDLVIETNSGVMMENLTFVAAPPDYSMLEKITYNNQEGSSEKLETTFQPWGVNLSDWSSVGVDGNGVKLSHKSLIWKTGVLESTANSSLTRFTVALWVKIPYNLYGNMQIFGYGGNSDYSETGMWIEYNKKSQLIEILSLNMTKRYISTLAIETGKWTHIAITLDSVSMKIYTQGSYIHEVYPGLVSIPTPITASFVISTAPPTTTVAPITTEFNMTGYNMTDFNSTFNLTDIEDGYNNTNITDSNFVVIVDNSTSFVDNNDISTFLGTVICLPGWVQFRLSCYRLINNFATFWEQERHCQTFGGHMVTIEGSDELSFIKSYLSTVGPHPIYFGVYDDLPFISTYVTRRWKNIHGKSQQFNYFQDSFLRSKNAGYNFVTAECDPECNFDVSIDEERHLELCEINHLSTKSRIENSERCPSGWSFYDNNCYKVMNVLVTATDAAIECTKQRAVLAEIKSIEQQRFLANKIMSMSIIPTSAYIGIQLMATSNGNYSYKSGDLRPVDFTYWSTTPLYSIASPCVIMNCLDVNCHWQEVACTGTYDAICQKPAETRCAPGWRLFKNRCVAVYQGTNADQKCKMSNTDLLTLASKAELEEYLYFFPIIDTTVGCLTDGIVDPTGQYIWKTTGDLTYLYYSGQVLSGIGQCISMMSTGLQRTNCTPGCSICQYYMTGGVGVDNVYTIVDKINDAAVANLVTNIAPRTTYIGFGVKSTSGTSLESYDNATSVIFNMTEFLKINHTYPHLIYPLNTSTNSCFSSLGSCKQGITIQMWIYVSNISQCTIVDMMSQGNTGMKLWIESETMLYVSVTELNYYWRTWMEIVPQEWIYLTVTWQQNTGLSIYSNFKLIHTEKVRRRTWPFTMHVIPTSEIQIGICENTSDTQYILLEEIIIRDEAIEDWVLSHDQVVIDKRSFLIDFNLPLATSNTNINTQMDSLTVSSFWRNSLFHTAVNIDNPTGITTAIGFNQTMHCFTQSDLCQIPFTISLWLQPRSMETDQIFLSTGTKSNSDLISPSYKLWYNTTSDNYFLELYYDKTHFTVTFYLILYKWYHIVIKADLPNSDLKMFVNGEPELNITSALIMERLIPRHHLSFFEIGSIGQFYFDDLRFEPKDLGVEDIYKLPSCRDYKLAGFRGSQNLSVIGDGGWQIEPCDLDVEVTPYILPLDMDNLTRSNVELEFWDTSKFLHVPGVHSEAIELQYTGFNISNMTELCFHDIKDCFFGLTVALWVKIMSVNPNTNYIVLYEFGGNINANESGILMDCNQTDTNSTTLDCKISILNDTRMWRLPFSLSLNRWFHLAVTWNSYRTMTLYINGHSTTDLGVFPDVTDLESSNSTLSSDNKFVVSASSYEIDTSGLLIVDEFLVLERDAEDPEIKQFYGKTQRCFNLDWDYNSNTELCYTCKFANMKNYDDAEMDCQAYGGNLVYIPDYTTYSWIKNKYDGVLPSNGDVHTALKQMPRNGHPIRWPDGSYIPFSNNNLQFTNLVPRYCGLIPVYSPVSVDFCVKRCSFLRGYICQTNPMYTMAATLHFEVNSTMLTNSTEDGYTTVGNISYTRGITPSSLVFNNSAILKSFKDTCLINLEYCHNGVAIKFWFYLLDTLESSSREIILNTMTGPNSYGLYSYIYSSGGTFMLGIDLRATKNFTGVFIPVSVLAWTHVTVSINNMTDITVYLNGFKTSDYTTMIYNETDVAYRNLGESADYIVGSDWTQTASSNFIIDKYYVKEVMVTDQPVLFDEVSPFFQDFVLSMDDTIQLNITSTIKHSNGWLGNGIFLDATLNPGKVTYKGQLAFDCLGAPELCIDGLTTSVWIYPEQNSVYCAFLSTFNSRSGFLFHGTTTGQYGFSLYNYTGVSSGSLVAHQFPLRDYVWSNIIGSWYKNGTAYIMINGIFTEIVSTAIYTPGAIPSAPVNKIEINHMSSASQSPASCNGGVDEFMFYQKPMEENDLFGLYKNMTYAKNQHYWSLDTDCVTNTSDQNVTMTTDGIVGNACTIEADVTYLNLSNSSNMSSSCLVDIDSCVHGFTLNVLLKFLKERDTDQMILSTGGHDPDGLGLSLMYTARNKSLPFRRYFEVSVLTTNDEYKAWFNLQWGVWSKISITWHKRFGLQVFIDKILAWHNETGATRLTPPAVVQQNLMIGRKPDVGDPVYRGIFAVDELHFWDRASFEDTNIMKDTVFKHIVHKSVDTTEFTTQIEVTRDECQSSCVSTSCQKFVFCNANRYGTCHIISDNATSAAIVDSPDCDFFEAMSAHLPVQRVGCLNNTCISQFSVIYVNDTSIESCITECQQFEYHYLVVDGDQCHCAQHDVVEQCITFFNDSLSSNMTCEGNQLLVHQITGLRPFLNVTVPIEMFMVDISPGTEVAVNQVLDLNFTVTAMSYAGYRLDYGNGSAIVYTGYNTTTVVYSEPGEYTLDIIALNEISWMQNITKIQVFLMINGMSVNASELVATGQSFNTTVIVNGGSNVTCNVTYGDGSFDSIFNPNTTEPYIFTYAYSREDQNTINVTCYNSISSVFNQTQVLSVHPIQNLSIIAPDTLVFGQILNVSWIADLGSNVSMVMTLDGNVVYNNTNWLNLSISEDIQIPLSTYLTTGLHLLNLTAENIVTDPVSSIAYVIIDREITSIELNFNKSHVKVNESANYQVILTGGSNVNISVYWVNMSLIVDFITGDVLPVIYLSDMFNMTYAPGEYDFFVTAENTVSNQNFSYTLYVEAVVDSLTLNITEAYHPLIIDVTIATPSGYLDPTNALYSFDFGDGTLINNISLEMTGGILNISYNYSAIGYYDVWFTVFNNVSSLLLNNTVQIGYHITNLSVTASRLYIPLGDPVTIQVTKDSGSLVLYSLDFNDWTNMSYIQEDNFLPQTLMLNYTYANVGVYKIIVFAQNVFNNMIAMTTVYVREKISGILLSGDTLGIANKTMYFNLQIFEVGTNSCFLFDYKDGTFDLYGDNECQFRPEFNGLPFTELTGDSIALSHIYNTQGDYTITVNSSNYVSYIVNTLNVKVLETPCADPIVDIYGFSKNITVPTHIYLTTRMVIPSKAQSFCLPPDNVLFKWCVIPIDQNGPPICNYPSLSSLSVNPYSLSYGLYEVNVTISMNNYAYLTASSKVYIKVVPSPLVLDLIGDERCTSPSTEDLVVNASLSYDPDFPNDQNFNITFYCGFGNQSLLDAENLDVSVLSQVGTDNCYSDIYTGEENLKSLIIPSDKLTNGMSLTFVVEMSKWNRTRTRIQRIEITTETVHKLAIRCKVNCKNHVSASLPYKAVAVCQTCVLQENYLIPYRWKLFEINGGTYTEIQNFQSWTKTSLTSPSLSITEEKLTPGKDYAIRLESGDAYTVKIIHVTQPPYNGDCRSNTPVGMAFSTVFMFSCDGWLDEGFRSGRNLLQDSSYLEDFSYTFYYKVIGRNVSAIPFFKTVGRSVLTPGVILGPGEDDHDNLVEITVEIKDRIYCSTEYSFLIQVINSSRISSDSVVESLKMNTSRAEMDITVVNLLCYSAIENSNMILSQNNPSMDDGQLRVKVVDILGSQTDQIQDEVHLSSSSKIMGSVSTNSDNVPLSAKEQISLMFQKLIEISRSLLISEELILLKNKISRDLLSNIIEYCQETKYLLGCVGGLCDEKFKVGEIAVELIPFVNNLTSLLLKGAVPEEEAQIMDIPQGNTTYYVQRKLTYNVRNNWISVQGRNVSYIPESSNMLDPYQISSVDEEIIISDNLFTTDDSVQAVKSRTISIALLDTDQGVPHVISNLESPILIDFYPLQSHRLKFTEVSLVPKSNAPMFYIKFNMNETQVIPVVVIRPKVEMLKLTYYIRTNNVPDNKTFDDKKMIDMMQESTNNTNTTSETEIVIKLDPLVQTALNDAVYIGLVPELESPLDEPLVELAVYVLGCSYWQTNKNRWSSNGVSIGNVTMKEQVPCNSSHLTTFSVNMFVPPNTIDFTTVWAKFENLQDNIVVFACVCSVIVLYFICLVFVRRADKRDIQKWAVYPLKDNVSSDVYHYQMTVYTGMRKNAGTDSKVYFVIGGEEGDTEIRELMDTSDRPLSTGSVNNYLLSVPYPLGNLTFLRIWHDNSGKLSAADWYLNMIMVKDIQTNYRYMFICDHWLALDKEDGEIERLVPVAGSEEIAQFGHMFYMKTRQDVTDGHLWVSVFSRPTRSTFTRVQRLSCCLSLLFTTMITNAMWYKTTDDSQNQQNVHLGPFVFSSQEFFTSLMGSLIVIPVNLLIITFFKKSRPSKTNQGNKYAQDRKKCETSVGKSGSVNNDSSRCLTPSAIQGITFVNSASSVSDFSQMNSQEKLVNTNDSRKIKQIKSKNEKSGYMFPHWCVYIAWLLVAASVIVSGLFVILYSLEWGYEKACQWFTSFMLSFVESVFLIQPLKVVAVAIVLILIFKKSGSDDEEDSEEVFILDDASKENQSYLDDIYPAHRKPYLHSPPDPEKVQIARDYRKKMNKLFNITREMLAYLVYLVIVAILTYENRDTNSIYLHSNMENIFVKSQGKYHKSFENVDSKALFWSWINTTVIPALYSEPQMYNNNQSDETSDLQNFLSDNIHYKIGLPRLRQARVQDTGCKVSKKMSAVIPFCFPEYSTLNYEGKNYSSQWNPYTNDSEEAWIYKTTFDLKGLPVVGQYGSYSGGGYVMHLGQTKENATQAIDYLVENLWIDRKTRAVFVEFNVFNPNINLFGIVQLLAEFPATGGVNPYPQIISLRLYRYHGESALFILIFDIIFVAFTVYYIVGVLRQLKAEKWSFITRFWNVIELLKVCLSIIACAFYGMQVIMIRLTLDDLHVNRESFVNFQHVILWDQLFGYIIAFLLFFAMLKVLLLLRFNSKITQLAGTLKKALSPLSSFFILFLFTIFAFAAFGHLVFGRSNREYVTLIDTLETLMSMLMMKMNIDSLITVNDILGSLYLFLFVLVIVFIQINILVSIINDVFTQVRQDPACLPDDPDMVDFILEQFKRVIFGSSDNSRGSGIHRNQPPEDKDVEFKFDKTHAKLLMFIDQFYRDKN